VEESESGGAAAKEPPRRLAHWAAVPRRQPPSAARTGVVPTPAVAWVVVLSCAAHGCRAWAAPPAPLGCRPRPGLAPGPLSAPRAGWAQRRAPAAYAAWPAGHRPRWRRRWPKGGSMPARLEQSSLSTAARDPLGCRHPCHRCRHHAMDVHNGWMNMERWTAAKEGQGDIAQQQSCIGFPFR